MAAKDHPGPMERVRAHFLNAVLVLAGGMNMAPAFSQAVPAPSSSWPDIVGAAKKEGTVFFYSASSVPVLQRLSDGFRKAYPELRVEFTRMNSGPMIARLDQERMTRVDGADVAIATEYAWLQGHAGAGNLLPSSGPAVRGWPAAFLHEGHFVTGSYEAFVLAYHSRLVANPPRSYADLLKPEFKGKLGIPQIPATVLMAWYDWLDKTQGMDFPGKVMAQNPKVYLSSPPLALPIASGEITASLLNNPSSLKVLVTNGAAIGFTVPDPAFAFSNYVAALRWSKRPNAALVLLDWLMSREGQTVWSVTGESASALKNIPGAFEVPGSETFYNPVEWTPERQKKYVERYNEVYKKP